MQRVRLISAALLLLCASAMLNAQQVVIDPSQIAASATNSAEQIDYMIDQLGELTNLGDKLAGVKEYVDNVFGEDGIGGKTIGVLEDLGTLKRLTETFNSSLQSMETYSKYIQESKKYGLSEANTLLMYLNNAKRDAQTAIEVARKILGTLGFTKKEKKDELEKITRELEEQAAATNILIDMELKTSIAAEGFCEFIDKIDEELTPSEYVQSGKDYGSLESSARGSMGIISLLLGLLGVASLAWGYLHYIRGTMLGDSSADLAFMRIGAAMIAGVVVLNIIASVFGFKGL